MAPHTLLLTGITGFHHIGDPRPPGVERPEFKQFLYDAALACGWRVGRIDDYESMRSFHSATLVRHGTERIVVINRMYPIAALALPFAMGEPLRFMDDETLSECLAPDNNASRLAIAESDPDITQALAAGELLLLASRADLDAPVTDADLDALLPAERQQARYWRPASVGEILFNWWD